MPKEQTPAVITVDFSNVGERQEGGVKAAHVPEGDYLLKALGCVKKWKKDEENGPGYLSWKFGIVAPSKHQHAGVVYFITSLKEEALWNLRNLMEDFGIKVPKSSVKIPIAEIIKKQLVIGATLADDEYEGKVKSVIVATFKKSQYEEAGEGTEDTDDDDDDEVEETPTAATEDEDENLDELELDDL
jgi:hypothetical protein